ncbi:lantibiotic immunity ABC transporter MutG family permease subunit [Clostridium sp. Mt-5]|uniref:Lantibiotic immunity ABC transporter MutG family permease subunit n=1 Tax=Clostridium moutaii TaxID=3240932 RepID=A0ABV4BTU1_9CLOT
MVQFFRFVRADFQKIRRSSLLWIHILVPLFIAAAFIVYYSNSTVNTFSKISGYFGVLSIEFPLIIGIVTSNALEQEADAGNFQQLLMARYKTAEFLSKIAMLFLLELFSLFIAAGVFAAGMEFSNNDNLISAAIYGKIVLLLFSSMVFLYFLHALCSLKFGSGASIGLGIGESLISALMLTGLGDGIWKWIPCAFGVRFSYYYIGLNANTTNSAYIIGDFKSGIYTCTAMTIAIIIISVFFFYSFEGRSGD